MKRLYSIVAIVATFFLTIGAAFAQLPSQPYLFGTWQGVMTVVPSTDGEPVAPPFEGEQFPFRLGIRDTNLVMYFSNAEGGWTGIGEGADLRLNQQGRSAIVVAAMATGEDGGPTETWMLNISRFDEQNIAVYLSQVISADEANGQPVRPFKAFGQMQRVSE